MKRETVALDDCVERALVALQTRIEETDAVIERDSLPHVVGDATMLTQLYQNLIGNALKFSDEGRPAIQLTAKRQGNMWVLGVRDNGIGIEPEYAEQIFKPFQRLHGRDKYEGSGIGLAICKKAVDRHGGVMFVESELGSGSHFQFTLKHQY